MLQRPYPHEIEHDARVTHRDGLMHARFHMAAKKQLQTDEKNFDFASHDGIQISTQMLCPSERSRGLFDPDSYTGHSG